MADKKIILGIHGLGNKPPEKLLAEWWIKSISEGLHKIDKSSFNIPFKMVYWADILHPRPLNPKNKNPESHLFIDEPYTTGNGVELKIDLPMRKKIFNLIETQIDKIFLNSDLSINFQQVTDKIIHHYFQDLEMYLSDKCVPVKDSQCSARELIQQRLLEQLKKYAGYKIMLVSHSMGSIIAFDVLNKYASEISVDTFVTIGSPLGLPVIVSRGFAEQKLNNNRIKKPHAPDSIKEKWFNFADPEDKVALDPTLADDYAENNLGVKARDYFIYNNYIINGVRNSHKSYGYLRAPEVALMFGEFLGKKNQNKIVKYFSEKFVLGKNVINRIIKGN